MNRDFITKLRYRGFFNKSIRENDASLYLVTPYKVIISTEVTKALRAAYLHTEEKGGIIWAKARTRGRERVLVLEKAIFIRNAIDDKPRADGRTSANAYAWDSVERQDEFQKIIAAEYLPITFHTHPINGNNLVEEIINRNRNMDTSEADISESRRLYSINGNDVHLPRALVMGNTIDKELFIRLYGGNNSPMSFEEASKEIVHENLNGLFSLFDWNRFSTGQKILTGVVAATAILGVVLRRKAAAAIVLAGAPLAMSFATKTYKPSPHYCRLSDDKEAIILVPGNGVE